VDIIQSKRVLVLALFGIARKENTHTLAINQIHEDLE